MSKYDIASDGNFVGTYEGETVREAIQAMIMDSGYESMDGMCDAGATQPGDIEAFEHSDDYGYEDVTW